MPTGNLPQSVMTFFVISWASVFLQCEFKFCVSPWSQSPCGELPRAWVMISWHYIWQRVRSVAQHASEACCSGSRDRRHTVSSELWRFFVQLAEGTGTWVWCVLLYTFLAWIMYETLMGSSLALRWLNRCYLWHCLSIFWRLFREITKQNIYIYKKCVPDQQVASETVEVFRMKWSKTIEHLNDSLNNDIILVINIIYELHIIY